MDFQLVEHFTYWWPVTVRMPDPDPANAGEIIEQVLKMKFQPLTRTEQRALDEELEKLTSVDEVVEHEKTVLAKISKNWAEVTDDKKEPVTFSTETLKAALEMSWFRLGVYNAYNESLSGEAARLGNSETPPEAGPSDG